MHYSIEPRNRRYVKDYGFLSFAKNSKYSQKFVDSATKSATDAIKTASKRAIQKIAEANGDLIGNKIGDKITSTSKKSPRELSLNEANNEIPEKRYIFPQERQQIIDELILI